MTKEEAIMENTFELEALVREKAGSRDAVKLREQGRLPAVMYGHKQEPQSISVNAHDFVEALHHGHRLMDIKIDGQAQAVLVKAVQYDHLGKNIIHADLIRVDVTEKVKVKVPIELKGNAKGTHEGGMIEEHVDRLEIAAVVSAIPEFIPVSIKEVGVGDALHARDIDLPEGIELISPADTLVVTCHLKAAAKSAEDAAEATEEEAATSPEVITEKKTDEGEA